MFEEDSDCDDPINYENIDLVKKLKKETVEMEPLEIIDTE
mgnify:CR=1 FL=1